MRTVRRSASLIYDAFSIARDYMSLAILICDKIKAGEIDIDPNLVDKVFIKNTRDEILNNIKSINTFLEGGTDERIKIAYVLLDTQMNYFERIALLNSSCEFLSDFSNTIVFRQYTNNKGREIVTVNTKIPEEFKKLLGKVFKNFEIYISLIATYMSNSFYSIKNIGFIKNQDIIQATNSFISGHIANSRNIMPGSNFLISADIKKFFPSVKMSNFYEFNITYEVLKHYLKGEKEEVVKYRELTNLAENIRKDYTGLYKKDLPIRSFENPYLKLLVEYNIPSYEDFLPTVSAAMTVFISAFMYNGRLPTGACYSPALSNFYMVPVLREIDSYILNNADQNIVILRYADDLTISVASHEEPRHKRKMLMSVLCSIESILNKYKLYLNYDKTKFYYSNKDNEINVNILGVNYCISPKINNNRLRKAPSKIRKECIDIVMNKSENYTPQELGKLNYAFRFPLTYIDIALHYNFEEKQNLLMELYGIKNYKAFIVDIKSFISEDAYCFRPGGDDSDGIVNIPNPMIKAICIALLFPFSNREALDMKHADNRSSLSASYMSNLLSNIARFLPSSIPMKHDSFMHYRLLKKIGNSGQGDKLVNIAFCLNDNFLKWSEYFSKIQEGMK